jgi:hypothetical protein
LRKGIINASGETRRLLEDYRKALKPGETIAKLEWDHAVTSTGREVSRRALRLTRKESYSPFSDEELIAKDFKRCAIQTRTKGHAMIALSTVNNAGDSWQ